MKCFALLLCSLTFLLPAVVLGQDVAPDVLIKSVSNEVLDLVRKDKDVQAGNTKRTMELISAKVLPHFNFAHMAQLAVGRNWRTATSAQQKTISDEFRTLLVRTYSKALKEYRNQTIDYKPFKMNPGDSEAKVRTVVTQSGARPIPIDYYLEKLPQGWKVYDIEVDGISLVINYRESFAAEVRRAGIDGLIKSLQAKNRTDDNDSERPGKQ
jgi:phospholipid transport system substrate-binding protein